MPFVIMIVMLAALIGFCFPGALSFSGIRKRRCFATIAAACFVGIGVAAPKVGDKEAIASTETTAPATAATPEQGGRHRERELAQRERRVHEGFVLDHQPGKQAGEGRDRAMRPFREQRDRHG